MRFLYSLYMQDPDDELWRTNNFMNRRLTETLAVLRIAKIYLHLTVLNL